MSKNFYSLSGSLSYPKAQISESNKFPKRQKLCLRSYIPTEIKSFKSRGYGLEKCANTKI